MGHTVDIGSNRKIGVGRDYLSNIGVSAINVLVSLRYVNDGEYQRGSKALHSVRRYRASSASSEKFPSLPLNIPVASAYKGALELYVPLSVDSITLPRAVTRSQYQNVR